MSSRTDILVGDNNLHNDFWGGFNVRNVCHKGRIIGLFARQRTHNLMVNGTITYSRSYLRTDCKYDSAIDIARVSQELATRALGSCVIQDRGIKTDYRIIRLDMDMQPNCLAKRVRYITAQTTSTGSHNVQFKSSK